MNNNRIKIIFTFIILSLSTVNRIFAVQFDSSHLPIVIIETNGNTILDEPRIMADMKIIWNDEGEINYLSDNPNNYDGKIAIEIRGSSSQGRYPKKQYAVETQNPDSSNNNVSLIGLPKENDWILHAPYGDKTLLRNVMIYTISQKLGWYASRCKYCELVLNGEYMGIYVLMEKIKRDKNRIDIARLNPNEISGDDITGGYILKIDKAHGRHIQGWDSDIPAFEGSEWPTFYECHDPDSQEIVPEQVDYIRGFVTDFENLMNSNDYNNSQIGYHTKINVSSFIDYQIMNMIAKNYDGYRLSSFLYKDKDSNDGRLVAGPVWDYNLAFGNRKKYTDTEGWQMEDPSWTDRKKHPVPFWWKKLWKDEEYKTALATRWKDISQTVLSVDNIFGMIDSITTYLGDAVTRNYERWPEVLGYDVWPVPAGYEERLTYQSEIDFLKDYLSNRIAWIDEQLQQIETSVEKENLVSQFSLSQNYPNPFNPNTTIDFYLPCRQDIKLSIYNMKGYKVLDMVKKKLNTGKHSYKWDGTNQKGGKVSAGVYIYKLESNRGVNSKKMILLK